MGRGVAWRDVLPPLRQLSIWSPWPRRVQALAIDPRYSARRTRELALGNAHGAVTLTSQVRTCMRVRLG